MVIKHTCLLAFLFIVQCSFTQSGSDKYIVNALSAHPYFEGDIYEEIYHNIIENNGHFTDTIAGKLVLSFIVNIDGSISSPSVVKGVAGNIDSLFLKAIEPLKFTSPAYFNGNKVCSRYFLPIEFNQVKFSKYEKLNNEKLNFYNKIEFSASLSRDTFYINDSIEVSLNYENISSSDIEFYPNGIISLYRKMDNFITYDNPYKRAYHIRQCFNTDSMVLIHPNGIISRTYSFQVDSNFFYVGENEISITYYFSNKTSRRFLSLFRQRKNGQTIRYRTPYIIVMVLNKKE